MSDFFRPEPPSSATHLVFGADPSHDTSPTGLIDEANERNNAYDLPDVTIDRNGNDWSLIHQRSERVIKRLLRTSGQPDAVVTSTRRTSEQQTAAMYDDLEKDGNARYLGPDVLVAALYTILDWQRERGNQTFTEAFIIDSMAALVRRLQDRELYVSKHIVDDRRDRRRYVDTNVIDILPSSVGWGTHTRFAEAGEEARRDGTLREFLGPHRRDGIRYDPVFHLEIRR
jgi:hypothetical protein